MFWKDTQFFCDPFRWLEQAKSVAGQGPNEADEMSASAFLAAVKGRLMEWGKVRWGDGEFSSKNGIWWIYYGR